MSMIGDNTQNIDYAAEEARRLDQDYGQLASSVTELRAEAEAIPLPITDEDGKGAVAAMLKRLRDTNKRVEGLREIEKTPHLRRGNAVDQWFGRLKIALLKDNRRDQDAVGDRLQAELTAYDTRKLQEEMERRRQEAARAAREAAAKAEEERKAREAAEAARLAAERARKPETAAAKAAVAVEVETTAGMAAVESRLAETAAEEAHVKTLDRPADVMRQRRDDGVMTTMATENFSAVTDRSKLDLEKLRPFFPLDALEKALRGYAASMGYSSDASAQISGATFGKRPKSVVR